MIVTKQIQLKKPISAKLIVVECSGKTCADICYDKDLTPTTLSTKKLNECITGRNRWTSFWMGNRVQLPDQNKHLQQKPYKTLHTRHGAFVNNAGHSLPMINKSNQKLPKINHMKRKNITSNCHFFRFRHDVSNIHDSEIALNAFHFAM